MNILAQELNTVLHNSVAGRLLSDIGERMYFPKGIIAQSAEAKKSGKTANATIGMAVQNGKPLILPQIHAELPGLTSTEAVGYAPTAGFPELQEAWKSELLRKNPTLAGKTFSLPVVVPGLTAGISYLCDLFLPEGGSLLTAQPAWDNYALITDTRRNAQLTYFTLFDGNGFNCAAFETAMAEAAKTGSVRVLLNFPQNPSGYSPTCAESKRIREIILKTADSGADVMVWCDDAYFGLNYEPDIEKESLFAFLADAHERVLAVKIDGPTKESYVWGFRSGFLTFSAKGLTPAQYEALNKKLTGAIRSSVSCAASPSQSILLKLLKNPAAAEADMSAFSRLLAERYRAVRACTDAQKNHPALTPLPYNSGYFMSFRCTGINAEQLRLKLLTEFGIGIIAIDESHIRVAFSSIDTDVIHKVYDAIYLAAEQLAKK